MIHSENTQTIMWERIALLCPAALYMFIFNVNVPHGDALRIVRQIDADELLWNPNHLLLDWFGFVWTKGIRSIGLDLSVLGGFELISALATLAALFLFHRILIELGVTQTWIRLLAVIGLFASKNFLSMAVSQYFFMLQMPFLLGALHCSIRYHHEDNKESSGNKYLYAIGFLMAIATGIEFNNVIPVFFVGVAMAMTAADDRKWNVGNALKVWGSAALIGFPLFVMAYRLSGTDSSFVSWLLAYAGEANSQLDSNYGLQMSFSSILTSGATLIFHLFFGNVIETAGLGTVIKVAITGQPLEFLPDSMKLALAGILMPFVGLGLLLLFAWGIRRAKHSFLVRLCLIWLGGYLVFNFLWPYSADLFWFQQLPFIWILIVLYLREQTEKATEHIPKLFAWMKWRVPFLPLVVFCLLVLNTLQTVAPNSMSDIDGNRSDYQAMLHDGDLIIVPGWDEYKWMMRNETRPSVKRMTLMDMSLRAPDDNLHISNLETIIAAKLETGNRVIVGRLFTLDRDSNPWYGLASSGWPRSRIQKLLNPFCARFLGTIDDVGFQELYECRNDVGEVKTGIESSGYGRSLIDTSPLSS